MDRQARSVGQGPRVLSVTAPPIRVVNTTGAGDGFTAGLVLGRLRGEPPGDAAARAAAMAAAVCEQDAPWPPDAERIAQLQRDVVGCR